MEKHQDFQRVLLMILVCLLPLFLLLVLAAGGVTVHPLLFLALILAGCAAMFFLMRAKQTASMPAVQVTGGAMHKEDIELAARAADVFKVEKGHRIGDLLVMEGKLLMDPDRAYTDLDQSYKDTDVKPLLQEDEAGRPLLVLSRETDVQMHAQRSRPAVNLILFLLTLVTTTGAGAAHLGVNLWSEPARAALGLPYALALMLILGAHEMGHYLAARFHCVDVTLPYFIPIPFALGTFGAFIRMQSLPEDRRALFDVAVAGPLAGLAFAIPALGIGLHYSQVVPTAEATGALHAGVSVNSSVLFAMLSRIALGDTLAQGHEIVLHPLAFAGWLGLFVTALNLLPIGQLDGGHLAHALFGRKNSHTIAMVALFSLILLGLFVWSSLLIWAIIVYFLAGVKSAPPRNDVSRLDPYRVAIGAFAFVLLFLIAMPVPHALLQGLGINCPYV